MQLSVQEAAQVLGVSPETVRRWARKGVLGGRSAGSDWVFDGRELERWARAQGMAVKPLARPAEPARRHLPFTEALKRGRVLHQVPGATPQAVLLALAAACPLPAETSSAALYEQLLQRELLFSTALGHGIALPHPRTPAVEFGAEPVAVLGLLEQPVEWRAIDHLPVHTAILVLCPNSQTHLQLLSRVAYMLRLPSFVDMLVRRAAAADILRVVGEREPALN